MKRQPGRDGFCWTVFVRQNLIHEIIIDWRSWCPAVRSSLQSSEATCVGRRDSVVPKWKCPLSPE